MVPRQWILLEEWNGMSLKERRVKQYGGVSANFLNARKNG
jgi:hypothetical protein